MMLLKIVAMTPFRLPFPIRYNRDVLACVCRDELPEAMRDDQRPSDDNRLDEEDDRFDDALDDIFGEDDEPWPQQRQQEAAQPPELPTPPASSPPDPEPSHSQEGHVFGPGNAPPPSSYDIRESPPPTGAPTTAETSIPVASTAKARDWRKIACFGCLGVTGIPALCLLVLVVIGFSTGDDSDATPTVGGVFVDNTPTPDPTQAAGGPAPALGGDAISERGEPYSSIMEGRELLGIELDGEVGIGRLSRPVPVETTAPLGDGWLLTVDSVTVDANTLVADANTFNEPPAEDRQYVIAQVTATNDTEAAATFDASFRLRLIGAVTDTVYTTFEDQDRCGVIPDAFEDLDIAPGASASGNVCWQVLIEDLNNLVLFSENFTDDEGAIWFSLTLERSVR